MSIDILNSICYHVSTAQERREHNDTDRRDENTTIYDECGTIQTVYGASTAHTKSVRAAEE